MRSFYLLCSLVILVSCTNHKLFAQGNFGLNHLSNLTYPFDLSNIWGYTAPNGTEYALVGTHSGLSIVSLANPAAPVEVASVAGTASIWREVRAYAGYAYVVADNTSDGILIIDLQNLPTSVTSQFVHPTITIGSTTTTLTKGHTVNIDENGYMYINGSNVHSGAPLIFDVFTTPGTLIYVGTIPTATYAHDSYARGDTLWTADIYAGMFSVYDVTNKATPVLLASHATPSSFTHNVWLSGDGRTLFTTDEVADAYVASYDVSDLNNIQELDRFRTYPAGGTGTIPHNTHVLNDYAITSYYTDGVVVIDGSRPNNLVKVAQYDTYPISQTGFYGDWGVYPYFPSGTIIASDINTGLHVFSPAYQRACWLEGTVTDASNGQAIFSANVSFVTAALSENSNIAGQYYTGIAQAGIYNVTYSKPGYASQTVSVSLANGVVTMQNVQLIPLVPFAYSGQVLDAATLLGISNAQVTLNSSIYSYTTVTDANGNFTISNCYADNYTIVAGIWGHKAAQATQTISGTSNPIQIALTEGYRDEFELDLGWSVVSTTGRGAWIRCVPQTPPAYNTFGLQGTPGADVLGDIGNQCFVTGNNNNGTSGTDDIDASVTIISSPIFNVSSYLNPTLTFQYWFVNEGGTLPLNDTLEIQITDGVNFYSLVKIGLTNRSWSPVQSIRLRDVVPAITTTMQIKVIASDTGSIQNIVEAAFDNFELIDALPIAVQHVSLDNKAIQLQAYPNPFTNELNVTYELANTQTTAILSVYNLLGQLVENRTLKQQKGILQVGEAWEKGVYFIRVNNTTIKIIKQ